MKLLTIIKNMFTAFQYIFMFSWVFYTPVYIAIFLYNLAVVVNTGNTLISWKIIALGAIILVINIAWMNHITDERNDRKR